ncbi:MAG: helix-turn-helix domain-containing protein, partial [Kiloniellaceae bacterium]
EEIGQHLGLTPETVSRMLTRLTGDDTIAIPRPSRIRLLDPARLRCLAEGGSPRRGAAPRAARGAGAA